jgi:AraC-like DNA-binding protein
MEPAVRFWALDYYRKERIALGNSEWALLVFAEAGPLHVIEDSGVWIVPSTTAYWTFRNPRTVIRTLGAAKVRSLFIHPSIAPYRREATVNVRPLFRELIIEACRTGPLYIERPRDEAMIRLLMDELAESATIETSLVMPQDPLLARYALRFASGDESAELPAASRRTLERQWLASCGTSLGRWRTRARLLRAYALLAEGATVCAAATESGYSTASSMIAAFRKEFGLTPGSVAARAPDVKP